LAHGSLVAIQIGREAEGRLESVAEVRAIPGKGLEGDRYFRGEGSFSKNPGGGRQVTHVMDQPIRVELTGGNDVVTQTTVVVEIAVDGQLVGEKVKVLALLELRERRTDNRRIK